MEEHSLPAVVHQAAGMVSVQVNGTVDEALQRLREYATSTGEELVDLATAVVERRLRFEP